ncbi:MAG: Uma2 family endonuclease [Planctomycetota bacterium]
MTAEEFAAYAAKHGRCELIHGEVRALTPASYGHGLVTSRLNTLIGHWVMNQRIGEVFAAETGFRLDDERGPVVRAPDIAFIAQERLPGVKPESFATSPPDLIVETLSPGDTSSEVSEKIMWWLSQGVKEAWVADPGNKTVTLHWPDSTSRRFAVGQSLDASRALPGLVIDLAMVFD